METFLHERAIEYDKQQWAKTYLIDDNTDDFVLCGYFTLAMKDVEIVLSDTLSKSKATKFGLGKGQSVLLAQLGRDDRADHLSLNSIFAEIKPYVAETQNLVGGRILLIECEKHEKLCCLYQNAGFVVIGSEKSKDGVEMYQMAITIKSFLKIPSYSAVATAPAIAQLLPTLS